MPFAGARHSVTVKSNAFGIFKIISGFQMLCYRLYEYFFKVLKRVLNYTIRFIVKKYLKKFLLIKCFVF